MAKLVSSRPSQEGIEFKRELEGGHLPIQELCQPTPECLAPCHIPVNLITANPQSNCNEPFQGGKERAVVMREAVHVGQLARPSQAVPVKAKRRLTLAWASWLCTEGRSKLHGRWLESSSCPVVLPMLVFGTKGDWGKEFGGPKANLDNQGCHSGSTCQHRLPVVELIKHFWTSW